jgi:hypothetical protein
MATSGCTSNTSTAKTPASQESTAAVLVLAPQANQNCHHHASLFNGALILFYNDAIIRNFLAT